MRCSLQTNLACGTCSEITIELCAAVPLTDARSEVTNLLELHALSWTGWPGWLAAVPLVTKLSGDPDWVGTLLAEFGVAEETGPL